MNNLPFGFEKPEDSPGFLLWQVTTLWQRKIKKALENHGISHAQFVIMATLLWFEAKEYYTTQILIAKWSKLDKMTVSKALKNLVQLGYVHRIEHKADTRAKNITLTHEGKNLISKLVPVVEGIDQKFFDKTSKEEEKSFIQILKKIIEEK